MENIHEDAKQPQAHGDAANIEQVTSAPECYGTGRYKVLDGRYGCFHWVIAQPSTCFSCPFERRCLAQQARMRRSK